MRRPGGTSLIALAAVVLGGCGAGEAASPSASPSTVGNVGILPTYVFDEPSAPRSTRPGESVPENDDPPPVTPIDGGSLPVRIGELAEGNRLLVLGDSVLEATSTSFGGEMCARLVPHGWAVEIDAENGRDAAVGLEVLEDRLDEGEEWDAAVVMIGNNYRDDPDQFGREVEEIIDQLSPAPILLLTVTEFRDDQAEVNYVLRAEAAQHDNVHVLEWADRTTHDDSLVGDDGLHLSERGKIALVAMVRLALGEAPMGSYGACLDA
jgi:hypothetical protein